MGITEVVRGSDLLASAPRQIVLAQALGGTPPTFAHLPLVIAAGGARLAKRGGGSTLREQRAAGVSAAAIVGMLAHTLGFRPTAAPVRPRGLVGDFDPAVLTGRPTAVLLAPAP